MAAPNNEKLIEAAMGLRGAAPEQWARFTDAMNNYSVSMLAQMISCDPNLLQRAQGMSLAANEIAGLLRDAPRLFEQNYIAKEKARNVASQR